MLRPRWRYVRVAHSYVEVNLVELFEILVSAAENPGQRSMHTALGETVHHTQRLPQKVVRTLGKKYCVDV